MSEEDIYCTKCNNKTEQALMLSCEHNLCLSCAAKALKNQKVKNFYSSQYIKCDNCNSLTEIEPDTIKQILSEGYDNNQNYDNENYVIDNMESNDFLDLEDNNMNKINYPSTTGNQKNNKINKKINGENNSASEINIINDLINNNSKCKEHGEILNYLCLDCMSNCICTECVVHGIHRNHEVLNIKKAYPLIYNKMQDLSKYVNDQIKEVSLISETISKKKNFINTLIDRCKNEIHNTFEQIKMRLDNKEKEIINNTTNILKNNIYELNNCNNLIQKKLSTLSNLVNQINNIVVRKDELNTINYFCENNNNILEQAELSELNNLQDLDTFNNIKIEPDKITLSKLIEGMNTFHFNINNINDINNAVQMNNNLNKNNNNYGIKQNFNTFNNQINNNINMNKNRNQLMRNNQVIHNNNMNKRPQSSKAFNQNRQINNMMQFNNNLNTFQNNRMNNMNNMNRNNNFNNNNQDNYNY